MAGSELGASGQRTRRKHRDQGSRRGQRAGHADLRSGTARAQLQWRRQSTAAVAILHRQQHRYRLSQRDPERKGESFRRLSILEKLYFVLKF